MNKVFNWQLGRDMEYPYEAAYPDHQFAFIFNINRCIGCQSCTMACKSTWTFAKGQEAMWWNNVETKPYGGYPHGWDVKTLDLLEKANPGGQTWGGAPKGRRALRRVQGQDHLRGRQEQHQSRRRQPRAGLSADRRGMGRPEPLRGQPDRRAEGREGGRVLHRRGDDAPTQDLVLLPGPHLQPLLLPGLPRRLPAQRHLQAPRGRHRADRPGALPRLPQVHGGLPLQEDLLPRHHAHQREVHRLLSARRGQGSAVRRPAHADPLHGRLHRPDPLAGAGAVGKDGTWKEERYNPLYYLIHVAKVALPLYPQFGTEPNGYYIPPRWVPRPYLRQMFGPGVDAAIERYVAPDRELLAVLQLFGKDSRICYRYEIKEGPKVFETTIRGKKFELFDDTVIGFAKDGSKILEIKVEEPFHVRDAKHANSI
jgi:hypothetical protein